MQRYGTGYSFIRKIAVLYIIVWSISPPLEVGTIYRLLALGAAGIWALSAMGSGYRFKQIHVYAVLFAVIVAVIAYVEKGTFDAILQQIAIYILVVCFLINGFYEDDWKELKGIIPIVLLLLIIFNYRTTMALIEDPTIARKLVRDDESVYMYLRQGIGGYSLIYPQVCIFPVLIAWIRSSYRKNNWCFLIGMVWLATYVACLANAGYSIAIFTSIASLIVLFVYKGRSALLAFVFAGLIFLGAIGAILYLDGLREWLLQFFDGTAVAKKIEDMVLSTQTGAAEGSIYARTQAYQGSIEVILNYPIIGSLWNRSGGGHSAILDILAKYGVLGCVIYNRMLFHMPNRYKNCYRSATILSISNAAIVAILFVAILDSFPYAFMCMIIIVLPLLYEDIIRWEEIK